jgi:hypothetical protein
LLEIARVLRKVVCFFQSAHKFKARYATFRFEEARIVALVKRAVS